MSAILTVNSPFLLMNSRVPSSGSTKKKAGPTSGLAPAAVASSETIGMPGAASLRAGRMMSSASWSAAVTGVLSSFSLTTMSVA